MSEPKSIGEAVERATREIEIDRTASLRERYAVNPDAQEGPPSNQGEKPASYVFKNPVNGHIETVSAWSSLWVLLFGAIYLLVKGLMAHAFIWLIGAVISAVLGDLGLLVIGIMSIVYALTIRDLLRARYLRRGWIEVFGDDVNTQVAETDEETTAPNSQPEAPVFISDELRKLAELKNDGLLTDDEFQAQKERLLAR